MEPPHPAGHRPLKIFFITLSTTYLNNSITPPTSLATLRLERYNCGNRKTNRGKPPQRTTQHRSPYTRTTRCRPSERRHAWPDRPDPRPERRKRDRFHRL